MSTKNSIEVPLPSFIVLLKYFLLQIINSFIQWTIILLERQKSKIQNPFNTRTKTRSSERDLLSVM